MAFIRLTYIPAQSANGAAAMGYVIFRPGGVDAVDVATTWAGVEARITATLGLIKVYVDSTLAPAIVPATADTECYGRVVFAPYVFNITSGMQLTVADGGRLRNPFTFMTLAVTGTPTTVPYIRLDIPGTLLICREGGNVSLQPGSTVSAVEIIGDFCEIAAFEGATYTNNSGNPLLPTIAIDPAVAQVLHAIISAAGSFLPSSPTYGPDLFGGGGGGTTLLQIYDSSAPPVVQTNFLGGYFGLPMSNAIGTAYQDALTTPLLGVSEVQAAIDILKRRVTGAGPTASRPAVPADINTGGVYFDTDLGIPVFSNGVAYIDANGTVV